MQLMIVLQETSYSFPIYFWCSIAGLAMVTVTHVELTFVSCWSSASAPSEHNRLLELRPTNEKTGDQTSDSFAKLRIQQIGWHDTDVFRSLWI